jgi:mannose/cellobiose epimerase-like protein (N-acyl-D-glucosamine 2-epimerase family)
MTILFLLFLLLLFADVAFRLKAIPSSSPTHSRYVEWEEKCGKWCKRFMQLREHGIWISKRDTVSSPSSINFFPVILIDPQL